MNRIGIIGAVFLMLACGRQGLHDDKKMNAVLREQVLNNASEIHFSGECVTVISAPLHAQFEKTGVSLQSVNGRFFTATGNAGAIRALARMKAVRKLEAVPKYHLKSDGEE